MSPPPLPTRGAAISGRWTGSAPETARRGVYLYHYSLLFPWQVEQKTRLYQDEKPDWYADVIRWADESYFRLKRPYRVHNQYRSPSWLERFSGHHPPQVVAMMNDVLAGRTAIAARRTDDVERLLGCWWYPVGRRGLIIGDLADRYLQSARHRARQTGAYRAVRPLLPMRRS